MTPPTGTPTTVPAPGPPKGRPPGRKKRQRPSTTAASWWSRDEGRVTAFVVVLAVALLAVTGLTLDGGRALAAKTEAIGKAESAARAGADAIDLTALRTSGRLVLVPDRAAAAARAYLAAIDTTGQVVVDGDQVTVTVTATTPTQLLGLLGIRALTVHATGTAHPRRGIGAPNP